MGYHKKEIPKGVRFTFSKIKEEFLELEDAVEQSDALLALCELSDLIGAIEDYIAPRGFTIEDLKKFSDKTKEAFEEGKR